ncbi:MAG: NUDIX domain-containing protein [bacterium]|nr:NUDIX domain-containing protein [bacterium]
MSHIRVSANAAVVRDGRLLLVEFDDANGLHYNLPGGGCQPGETLEECVRREVLEETCAQITVGRVLLLREYEPERVGQRFGGQHKLNVIFEGYLVEGSEPRLPDNPDAYQTGVRWVPLADLQTVDLVSATLPAQLLDALSHPERGNDLYSVET